MGTRSAQLKVDWSLGDQRFRSDLSQGVDLTRYLHLHGPQARCFAADPATAEPQMWQGTPLLLEHGSPVQSMILQTTIHGNGTHTESSRHVTSDGPYLGDIAPSRLMTCLVLHISHLGAIAISDDTLALAMEPYPRTEALVLRCLDTSVPQYPDFGGMDIPYLSADAMTYLADRGIEHFLTDLPSVDPEQDGGALAAHHAFWAGDRETDRRQSTITELLHIAPDQPEGIYLIQIAPLLLDLDAAPSRVIIYQTEKL